MESQFLVPLLSWTSWKLEPKVLYLKWVCFIQLNTAFLPPISQTPDFLNQFLLPLEVREIAWNSTVTIKLYSTVKLKFQEWNLWNIGKSEEQLAEKTVDKADKACWQAVGNLSVICWSTVDRQSVAVIFTKPKYQKKSKSTLCLPGVWTKKALQGCSFMCPWDFCSGVQHSWIIFGTSS